MQFENMPFLKQVYLIHTGLFNLSRGQTLPVLQDKNVPCCLNKSLLTD